MSSCAMVRPLVALLQYGLTRILPLRSVTLQPAS